MDKILQTCSVVKDSAATAENCSSITLEEQEWWTCQQSSVGSVKTCPSGLGKVFSDPPSLCWQVPHRLSPGAHSQEKVWYKQWKVRSGCLEKFSQWNSKGSSNFPEGCKPKGKSDDPRKFSWAYFSDNHWRHFGLKQSYPRVNSEHITANRRVNLESVKSRLHWINLKVWLTEGSPRANFPDNP